MDALDAGKLRVSGADARYDETPDLASNKLLVGRDNVIINTPFCVLLDHGYRRSRAFELREHRPFPERREGEGIQAGQRGGWENGDVVASTYLPRCAFWRKSTSDKVRREEPPIFSEAIATQALCRTSSGSVGERHGNASNSSWVRCPFSRESG